MKKLLALLLVLFLTVGLLASCGDNNGSQGAAEDVNKGAMAVQASLQGAPSL